MRTLKSNRLDNDLIAEINVMAEKEGRSFSNMVEHLLKKSADDYFRAPAKSTPIKEARGVVVGSPPAKRFVPPTVEEVDSHLRAKGYNIDAEAFVAHYEANGWMRGKNKIKNWKACCTTWAKRQGNGNGQTQGHKSAYQQRVEAGDAKSFNIDTEF